MSKLEEFAKAVCRSFEENSSEFVPHFFAETPDRVLMIPSEVHSDEEKSNMLSWVRAMFARSGVTEYFHVTDTWMVIREKADDFRNQRVSDQPDRVEALVVLHVMQGEVTCKIFKHRIEEGKVQFEEEVLDDGTAIGGSYAELLSTESYISLTKQAGGPILEAVDKLLDQHTIKHQG